ncbi:MAG: TolB family protein [Methanosarcinales archaeon]
MKIHKIKVLAIFSIAFLTLSCGSSEKEGTKTETPFNNISLKKWNIRELDATNVELVKNKMLCEHGDYPRWSPDGKKILYSLLTPKGSEVWQMNSDGSKKEFIVKGTHGSWSPDGEQIAFLTKSGWTDYYLAIFDLKQKKVLYQDENNEISINGPGILNGEFDVDKLYWVENRVFFISSLAKGFVASGSRIEVLDLDTLKWQYSSERRDKSLVKKLKKIKNFHS